MEVDVQIQASPEALDDGDAPSKSVRDPSLASLLTLEAEECPHIDVQDGTAQSVVPGEQVIQGVMWALPIRPGEEGSRYRHAPRELDVFEHAGVVELNEGQRGPAFRLAALDGGSVALED